MDIARLERNFSVSASVEGTRDRPCTLAQRVKVDTRMCL